MVRRMVDGPAVYLAPVTPGFPREAEIRRELLAIMRGRRYFTRGLWQDDERADPGHPDAAEWNRAMLAMADVAVVILAKPGAELDLELELADELQAIEAANIPALIYSPQKLGSDHPAQAYATRRGLGTVLYGDWHNPSPSPWMSSAERAIETAVEHWLKYDYAAWRREHPKAGAPASFGRWEASYGSPFGRHGGGCCRLAA